MHAVARLLVLVVHVLLQEQVRTCCTVSEWSEPQWMARSVFSNHFVSCFQSLLEIRALVPERMNLKTNLACSCCGVTWRVLCAVWVARVVYGFLKARTACIRLAGLSGCLAVSMHHNTVSSLCCLPRRDFMPVQATETRQGATALEKLGLADWGSVIKYRPSNTPHRRLGVLPPLEDSS